MRLDSTWFMRELFVCTTIVLAFAGVSLAEENAFPGLVSRTFIYEKAPFPECHASTLIETKSGMVAAWFGGTYEKHPDVGIWVSHLGKDGWSKPVEVANGVDSPEKRFPTWNPVLVLFPSGKLTLFYKKGPSPDTWWGMKKDSTDDGKTWSAAEKLPDGFLGPVKNKPIFLPDGKLLCGSSTENCGWVIHYEIAAEEGTKWEKISLSEDERVAAIQPTILKTKDGYLSLLRPRKAGTILQHTSADGRDWSQIAPTNLPNPGSGIDGVTLANGKHLLVYNHTTKGRSPLNLAMSDDGKTWKSAAVLESEPGEYSYPAIIQAKDGKVHISYTWKREKVRYLVVDADKLEAKELGK